MTFAVVVLTVVNVANDALDRLFAVVAVAAVVHILTSFPGRNMTIVRFLPGFILPRDLSYIHIFTRK